LERLQTAFEILRRRLDAQDTGKRCGRHLRRIHPELLVQFLARSYTDEADLNVFTGAQSRHFDQSSSQGGDLDRIFMLTDIEEFLNRNDPSRSGEKRPIFPNDVLDAIHVICHERLPRERDGWRLDSTDRPLDGRVTSIADGHLDSEKQDAIYVR
jgi:hypothetical protein